MRRGSSIAKRMQGFEVQDCYGKRNKGWKRDASPNWKCFGPSFRIGYEELEIQEMCQTNYLVQMGVRNTFL